MTTRQNKIVLLLRTRLPITNRQTYEGVYRYARSAKWQVQTIRVPSVMDASSRRPAREERKRLREMLSFWQPDGCIVMGDACAPYRDYRNFGAAPVVYCDALPGSLPEGSNLVSIDSRAVAACAARELLSLGLAQFAYVSYHRRLAWCEARRQEFARIVAVNGKAFAHFRLPWRGAGESSRMAFDRWLKGLPKPVGVFAANDTVAEALVGAAIRCGLSVPQEVALVGVDNDELVCENAAVSISSVVPEFGAAGETSARLLDELMAKPRLGARCTFGVGGLVRRASTRKTEAFDPRVAAALEYIRRHACEGIGVPDVIASMGCSRRHAELRFSRIAGSSILQEIRRTKVERVMALLRRSSASLVAIADMCGFASCDDMRRTFRQFEGQSPTEWRQAAAPGNG